jgi:hypothetical protein
VSTIVWESDEVSGEVALICGDGIIPTVGLSIGWEADSAFGNIRGDHPG